MTRALVLFLVCATGCGGATSSASAAGDGGSDAGAPADAGPGDATVDAGPTSWCRQQPGPAPAWCADFDENDPLAGWANGTPATWLLDGTPPPAIDTATFTSSPASARVPVGAPYRAYAPVPKSVALGFAFRVEKDATATADAQLASIALGRGSPLVISIDTTGAIVAGGKATNAHPSLDGWNHLRVNAGLLSDANGTATYATGVALTDAAGTTNVSTLDVPVSGADAADGRASIGPGSFATGWTLHYDDVVLEVVPR